MKTSKHLGSKKSKLDNVYLTIFSHIQNGLNISQICDKENMSKQALNRYIRHLKANGFIQKIGYGVWKTSKHFDLNTLNIRSKQIRTHAFILTLSFNQIRNIEILIKNLNPVKFKNRDLYKFIFKNCKFQISNNKLVFYQPKWKSYFVSSAKTGKNYVIYDFLQLVASLERLLGISFKINKNYKFKVDREHHAMIHNELAKQYAKDNRSLKIWDEKGYFWLSFDNSDFNNVKLEELETHGNNRIRADYNMDNVVAPFFNSLKRNPITVDDVLNMIGNVTQNQAKHQESMIYLDKNLQTHFAVLDRIKEAVKDLSDEVKKLNKGEQQ